MTIRALATCICILATCQHLAVAKEDSEVAVMPVTAIAANNAPAYYVRAEFVGGRHDYQEGDQIRVQVTPEIDSYLYVLYQQADGKVFQIYPNAVHKNNKAKAGVAVNIPANDDLFRWNIGAPYGEEWLKVIASREPLKQLSDPKSREGMFNAVSGEQLKQVKQEVASTALRAYAEVDLKLTTYGPDQKIPLGKGRRIGLFLGVSEYMWDGYQRAYLERLKKEDPKTRVLGMNLRFCDKDATQMAEVMSAVGSLDEARILVNDACTRAAINEAITQWLPRVSRPGDTVFIVFSGHGSRAMDDNDDEADGLDEFLVPHDAMSPQSALECVTRLNEGTLDKTHQKAILALVEKVKAAWKDQPEEKHASIFNQLLAQETQISDDLFGRWLLQLSDRQIAVIIDACHSGGLAVKEKGTAPGGRSFDFIQGEMRRLKGIGGSNQALLASSYAAEESLEDPTRNLGLLTRCVIDVLQAKQAKVPINDVMPYAEKEFAQFYEQLNEALLAAGKEKVVPQHPYLIDLCTEDQRILLKK